MPCSPLPDPGSICFGLSLEDDRRSCGAYLCLLGRPECAELVSSRLSSDEIDTLVELVSNLMRTHLSKQEYHRTFLGGHRTMSSLRRPAAR